MKDLKKLMKECLAECDKANIPYGDIVDVVINTRAKKRWGRCSKKPYGFVIEVNQQLLDDKITDVSTKTTIIHEIIHTCPGCMNHGEKWKKWADVMNKKYGYNITRTTSAEDKGIERTIEDYKYTITCAKCGCTSYYMRKSRVVEHITSGGKRCRCGACGSHDFTWVIL